jgi:hypothetical protein
MNLHAQSPPAFLNRLFAQLCRSRAHCKRLKTYSGPLLHDTELDQAVELLDFLGSANGYFSCSDSLAAQAHITFLS